MTKRIEELESEIGKDSDEENWNRERASSGEGAAPAKMNWQQNEEWSVFDD